MTFEQRLWDHWVPVALSDELPGPACEPVPFDVRGERLVGFKDVKERIGVIENACAHRRIPLHFGHVVDEGLRCGVHGWTYDCDGHRVDWAAQFNEPVTIKNYPAVESDGLIFCYLGAAKKRPAAPSARDEGQTAWLKAHVPSALLERISQTSGAGTPNGSAPLRWVHWSPSREGAPGDGDRRLVVVPANAERATVFVEIPDQDVALPSRDAVGTVLEEFGEAIEVQNADTVQEPARLVALALLTAGPA